MAKSSSKEEVTTGDVVALYWSPESENLILDGEPQIKFENFTVEVRNQEIIERMEGSPWKGKDFYRVHTKEGNAEYKKKLMGKCRQLLLDDPDDGVKTERGWFALVALFTQDELDKLGISRSVRDVDALILAVINTKYIEGIV